MPSMHIRVFTSFTLEPHGLSARARPCAHPNTTPFKLAVRARTHTPTCALARAPRRAHPRPPAPPSARRRPPPKCPSAGRRAPSHKRPPMNLSKRRPRKARAAPSAASARARAPPSPRRMPRTNFGQLHPKLGPNSAETRPAQISSIPHKVQRSFPQRCQLCHPSGQLGPGIAHISPGIDQSWTRDGHDGMAR